MIAYVQGRLAELDATYAVVDAQGVGYDARISLHTFAALKGKEQCKLYTHLAVSETAHTLYGFADPTERQLFQLLISVSGVGPATALMVLSALSPGDLKLAILNQDVNRLKSVKGIGPKAAQRLALELGDKVAALAVAGDEEISVSPGNKLADEALQALMTLGYARPAAQKSIAKILKTEGEGITLEALIKRVLQQG